MSVTTVIRNYTQRVVLLQENSLCHGGVLRPNIKQCRLFMTYCISEVCYSAHTTAINQ